MEMTFKKLDAQAVEITVCIAPLGGRGFGPSEDVMEHMEVV